jgi:hypothetical protein
MTENVLSQQDITNAIVSGIIAGVFASLISVCIEKFGGGIGGILGGSPGTIVPSAIGLWITIAQSKPILNQQTIVEFQKCLFMTPAGMVSVDGVVIKTSCLLHLIS